MPWMLVRLRRACRHFFRRYQKIEQVCLLQVLIYRVSELFGKGFSTWDTHTLRIHERTKLHLYPWPPHGICTAQGYQVIMGQVFIISSFFSSWLMASTFSIPLEKMSDFDYSSIFDNSERFAKMSRELLDPNIVSKYLFRQRKYGHSTE